VRQWSNLAIYVAAVAISSGFTFAVFVASLVVVLRSQDVERLKRRASIGLFAFFLLVVGSLIGFFVWGLQD
jgi:hypothetical protein